MKVFNISDIKLKDEWDVNSIRISHSYEGLLEGSPYSPFIKEIYSKIIHKIVKNKSGFGEQAMNQVPRFQPNELLKSIRIDVEVTNTEHHADIITYMDETEELEDVLNEVIADGLFVVGELVF